MTAVAVLGGTGFIGRHLVAQLKETGDAVRILGTPHNPPEPGTIWVQCDIRDKGALTSALADIETVYNLVVAREPECDAAHAWEVNVGGAHNLCASATAASVKRIVFTSSAAVYGHGIGQNEGSTVDPRGAYAVAKLAAERVYREWAAAGAGRSLVVIRPTVVFGVGGQGSGARLLSTIAAPGFQHLGDGLNRKSLAFVENVAAFLAFAGRRPERIDTWNYADEPDLTIAEIATIVRSAIGLPRATHASALRRVAGAWGRLTARAGRARPAMDHAVESAARDARYDASRAVRSGFRQPVPIREALAKTAVDNVRWLALLQQAQRVPASR